MNNDDLAWFFNSAAADLGLQSNFGPIVAAIRSCGASRTSMPDSMSDKRMQAAERYRIIYGRLKQLPARHRDIIYAAYQPRRWSLSLTTTIGSGTLLGVTVFSKVANDFFEEDGGSDDRTWFQWLEGIVLRQEHERIAAIKRDTERILDKAIRAYDELSSRP